MVGRLTGVLDAKAAEQIVEFVEAKEPAVETGFNRFCDLSQLQAIHLRFDDVLYLATRRRAFNPNDVCVK